MRPIFKAINLNNGTESQMTLVLQAIDLLYKNRKALFDDFLGLNEINRLSKGLGLISHFSPYFWAIIDGVSGELAGVAYLYDVVGAERKPFSAYVSTCFQRKYWGKFVQRAEKRFFRYIFGKLRLHKVFAEIYADNLLGQRCVKRAGFEPIATHQEQTIRGGKLTDTMVFVKFRK